MSFCLFWPDKSPYNESMKSLFFIFALLVTPRIYAVIGGHVIDIQDIPAASVRLKTMQNNGAEFCSGTLINQNTVLTAAHCLGKSLRLIQKYQPQVELTFFLNGVEVTRLSNEYLAHPDYESHEKADLALVFINEPVVLDEYPKLSDVKEDDRLHVLGFGLNGSSDRIDGQLRETVIEIEQIRPRYFSSFNLETGPCSGDSGGAVFRAGTSAQEILGITYYVNPTLTPEQQEYFSEVRWDREQLVAAYPLIGKLCFNSTSYFMNISFYKNWIAANAKGDL